MNSTISERIKKYITAETGDSILYLELSKAVSNPVHKRLLKEFSEDEKSHAIEFQSILKNCFGICFEPEIESPDLSGNLIDILKDRVLDESGDFRKYGMEYMDINCNLKLRNAFYRARTDEAVHAFRLLLIISDF